MEHALFTANAAPGQYLLMKIANKHYGIAVSCVDNVIRAPEIVGVPKAQRCFRGIIHLRGDIIAVMSLRRKMKFAEDAFTDATRIVILAFPERGKVGMLVDEVKEIVTFAEEEIEREIRTDGSDGARFISGIGRRREESVFLFDPDAIFEELE